jgi:hypothetical protein
MGHFMDTALDAALVGTCCAYAYWLDKNKGLEPDHTWLEVTAGVALCLAHATLRGRNATKAEYEAHVLRSFALGGVPVVAGELRQYLERRAARDRYLRQGPPDLEE